MARQLIHSFTIKLAVPKKIKRESVAGVKISRKCIAVVISDNGKLKARINTSPVEETENIIVIDFTDKSFDLKGKTHVFLKQKDEYNHYICRIRTIDQALLFPGLNTQYDAIHEGLKISGYIIRKDGKLYFDYEDLVSFNDNNNYLENVRIKEDKPVFNEYNRNKSS